MEDVLLMIKAPITIRATDEEGMSFVKSNVTKELGSQIEPGGLKKTKNSCNIGLCEVP